MKTLILDHRDVETLLPVGTCMDVMSEALTSLAEGTTGMPMRTIMKHPSGQGLLGMMPAYSSDPDVLGIKVVSVFPGNFGTQYDSHQGSVLLFDGHHGRLLALVDATAVTAIRTAAVSALATDHLAGSDAETLALMGSGTQARTHLDAMRHVRDIKRVRVWSVPLQHARHFAERESRRCGLEIGVFNTPDEAAQGADIVCTVTTAKEPFLRGRVLQEGVHINAIGACTPDARELDTAAVAGSRLFVDSREAAMKEAGDVILPMQEGAIGEDHILGTLGDILTGKVKGRESESEVTLFKAVGLAIEDLAAAHHLHAEASKKNIGTVVELGGERS